MGYEVAQLKIQSLGNKDQTNGRKTSFFPKSPCCFSSFKTAKNNFQLFSNSRSWGGSSTSNDGWPSQLGHSAFGVPLNDLGKVHLVSGWFSNCLIVWWKNNYALHGSCFMPSFLAKIGPFLWNSSVDLDGFGHRFMQSLSTQCPTGPVSSKRQDWNCLTVGLKAISNLCIVQVEKKSSWMGLGWMSPMWLMYWSL